MTIPVTCPSCGQILQAKESAAGKRALCPGCGDIIQIPGLQQTADAVPDSALSATPPGNTLPDTTPATAQSTGDGNTFDAEEIEYESAPVDLADEREVATPTTFRPQEDRKPCPACGEMIISTAAKCRFCGQLLGSKIDRKTRSLEPDPDDNRLTVADWLACLICPCVGLLGGFLYWMQGRRQAGKITGISLLVLFVWVAIRAIIELLGT